MPLKIVFFGSSRFSALVLEGILSMRYNLAGVVTSEDKPAGRGRVEKGTIVKDFIVKHHPSLNLLMTEDLSTPDFVNFIRGLRAELGVVAGYGKIFDISTIRLFPKGMINVHPSLLPRLRGPAPIQRAIMEGLNITGVSLYLMDEGIDTGDIIDQEEVEILEEDNGESLETRLAHIGALLLLKNLDALEEKGYFTTYKQAHEFATYAPVIKDSDKRIDWAEEDVKIFNKIRALSPKPGAYTTFRGKRVKILASRLTTQVSVGKPGSLTQLGKNDLIVDTSNSPLLILTLQPEGSRPMSAGEFLRGYRILDGDSFI